MSAFECNRCGACCRRVDLLDPTLDRGNGVCKHLTGKPGEEHSCAIYETRPRTCRVDESCPPAMALAEWQKRNTDACSVLRLHIYGAA